MAVFVDGIAGVGGWTVFHLPSTPRVIEAVRSDVCGSDSAESEADLVVVVLGGLMARWVAQAMARVGGVLCLEIQPISMVTPSSSLQS